MTQSKNVRVDGVNLRGLVHYSRLAWEAKHADIVDEEMQRLCADPDLVYEAFANLNDDAITLLGQAFSDYDPPEAAQDFARLCYPPMFEYLRVRAVDAAQRRVCDECHGIDECSCPHESLTVAQRNPDLVA